MQFHLSTAVAFTLTLSCLAFANFLPRNYRIYLVLESEDKYLMKGVLYPESQNHLGDLRAFKIDRFFATTGTPLSISSSTNVSFVSRHCEYGWPCTMKEDSPLFENSNQDLDSLALVFARHSRYAFQWEGNSVYWRQWPAFLNALVALVLCIGIPLLFNRILTRRKPPIP